ncbi:UNVERIFIED_CONTAM: hypothetical protein GTU68_012522 [Idotea baltica]|nr:hypothetical protein [Idotea baltica]
MNTGTKTLLVTGGAGFIGSHVCTSLINSNHQVVCLDNFDPYYSESIKLRNIAGLRDQALFHMVKGDIRDPKRLKDLFSRFNIDAVVHLAAKAGVRESSKAPFCYFDNNVNGTLSLLDVMKDFGVLNLVFASSSSVYGDKAGAVKEEEVDNTPKSIYASSKIATELIAYNYFQKYDFRVVGLRFFSIYGERQRPDLVIHRFLRQIRDRRPLTIFGKGNQSRDFTHISEAVKAISGSIDLVLSRPKGFFEAINVGNSHPVSLNTVVALLQDAYGDDVTIQYSAEREEDPKTSCADISKAAQLLGYHPKVKFENGLKAFITWFEGQYNIQITQKNDSGT